jgi:hypothetical protein
MAKVKEGDRVRIASREQTEEDIKSASYFPHYAGLTGTILKVYGPNEVSVEVETDSLTREMRKRHDEVRDQMKTKWLDGLSEEGRSKLTEREKDFMLRYVVLVATDDLEKAGAKPVAAVKPTVAEVPAAPAAEVDVPTPPRRTLEEIEADELAELNRRAQQS